MSIPVLNESDIAADIMDWVDAFTFVDRYNRIIFDSDKDLEAFANAIVKHYKMEPREADVSRD